MMSFLKTFGAWGAAGFLAGVLLVTYAKPATQAGTTLLMLICVALFLVIGGIVGSVRNRKKS